MSAADGLRLGLQWAQNEQEQARLAREEAWKAQEREQQRQQWQRDAQARATLGSMYEKYAKDPTDQTGRLANEYGLKPADTVTPSMQSGYNQRQGFFTEGDSAGPSMRTPGLEPKFVVSPLRGAALDEFKLASQRGDFSGAAAARSKVDSLDLGAQAAQMQRRVESADAETLAKFAKKYTDSAHIPGSMVVDPKTHMTVLSLDGGKEIPLTKNQLAQYVTGLWKRSVGDPSGTADIAAIDKDLAAIAEKRFSQMKDVAGVGNDAVYKTNSMANDNLRTANSTAELGLRKHTLNKPDFVQLTNDKGEAVLVDRRKITTDEAGIARMPAGIRPQKLPQMLTDEQKLGLAAYYKSLETSPPQTPAEADQRKMQFGVHTVAGQGGGGMPGWGEKPTTKPAAASPGPAPQAASAQQDQLQPASPAEYRIVQNAMLQGYTPVGRGNSTFGQGELLFEDRQGNRVWASQLGQ